MVAYGKKKKKSRITIRVEKKRQNASIVTNQDMIFVNTSICHIYIYLEKNPRQAGIIK